MLATLKAVPLSPSPSSAHHHLRLPSFERRVTNVKERWKIFCIFNYQKCVETSSWHDQTCIFICSFVMTVLYILKSDLVLGTDKTKQYTKGYIQSVWLIINNMLEAKLMEL